MQVEQRELGSALVLTPDENRLDAANADEFKALVEAVIGSGHTVLIVDFAGIDFVDSRGLGVCIALLRQIEGRGAFCLSGLQPNVRGVFKLTRLDRVFRIFENLGEAGAATFKTGE